GCHAGRVFHAVLPEESSELAVLPQARAVTDAHREARVQLPVLVSWKGQELRLSAFRHLRCQRAEGAAEDRRICVAPTARWGATSCSDQDHQAEPMLHKRPNA